MSDRAGGARAKPSARPRFSRVARMMLRSAVILALAHSMSACVLPIAPEFQDPPTSPNYAPYFLTTTPPIGSIVTKPSFNVVVSDPNVDDELHFRWIADYPPFSENTRTLLQSMVPRSASGMRPSADLTIEPDCVVNNLAKQPRHQIMIVVADSAFSPAQMMAGQEVDLTRVPNTAGKVIATWTLEMECK
jgi:hypothetical protein